MNTRNYVLVAALGFCILLLVTTFIILTIGVVYNIRRDYVAAPQPTATVPIQPTPTILQMESPASRTYAQDIVDYNTALAIVINTMNDLISSPIVDPDVWATRLNTNLVVLLYAQADLQQQTPPAELMQLHNGMLELAAYCANVVERAGSSLNAHNLAALQQLADPLHTCRTGFHQANTVAKGLDPSLAWLPSVAPPQPVAIQRSAPVELPAPVIIQQAPIATQPLAPAVIIQPAPTAVPLAPAQLSPPVVYQPSPTAIPPVQLAPGACDPSYPDVCIPPPPPDLNCPQIPHLTDFRVIGSDPHDFDRDSDGIGCESPNR